MTINCCLCKEEKHEDDCEAVRLFPRFPSTIVYVCHDCTPQDMLKDWQRPFGEITMITPKKGWKCYGTVGMGIAYRNTMGIAVIYSIDNVEGVLQHHFSISYRGLSPSDKHINIVKKDWGLIGFERDDCDGNLAHLWRNV